MFQSRRSASFLIFPSITRLPFSGILTSISKFQFSLSQALKLPDWQKKTFNVSLIKMLAHASEVDHWKFLLNLSSEICKKSPLSQEWRFYKTQGYFFFPRRSLDLPVSILMGKLTPHLFSPPSLSSSPPLPSSPIKRRGLKGFNGVGQVCLIPVPCYLQYSSFSLYGRGSVEWAAVCPKG